MKIAIDLQGMQSSNRDRGIGRYSAALTKAFVQEASPKHELWLVSNSSLGNVESIREDFDDLVPQGRIVSFTVPQNARGAVDNPRLTDAGELLRENFLRIMDADFVWCSSLFEGFNDSSVTSVGRLATTALQAVTLYDLIPLSHKEYLADSRMHAWYYRKLGHLQRANVLLAISNYVRQDASELLNIEPDRIATISSAADERFSRLSSDDQQIWRESLCRSWNLNRPFVLCVAGDDRRKNVPLLIRAFAQLPKDLRNRHTLVLAYRIGAAGEATLRALAREHGLRETDVVFTNYVSDAQLRALYNLCALFVFPSLQEGFGLPLLEAMTCGAPVLAADATSLPEVVGRKDMLFPPTNAEALTHKMTAVLRDNALAEDFREYGLKRANDFSWKASAQRALEALESRIQPSRQTGVPRTIAARPKLAYVSPLPPERTGIAAYSAELLPALERHYDIEVVVDQATVDDAWVTANYPVRSVAWFRANAHRFDRLLYQIGNSHFHAFQLSLIADFPGTVMMHDTFLSGLSAWFTWHSGDPRPYLQRLYHAHGYHALLDNQSKGRDWTVWHYPSNWQALEHAVGIIVHSQYAIEQLRSFYGDSLALEARKVSFPKRGRAQERNVWRDRLGIRPEDFVVCTFGILAPTKLNHRVLSAWLESSLSEDVNCHLVFVGENHGDDYGNNLLAMIRNSRAAKRIRITGYVDDNHYHGWLEAADLAIQLRTQSRGETSASVFDCMGHGLPTIANAHATFAELDSKAVYLLPDLFDDADLASALDGLYRSPQKRQALSERARRVIDEHHHPIAVAGQYRDAIECFSTGHFIAREQELSRDLMNLSEWNDSELWELATAMRDNRRPRTCRTLYLDVTAIARHDLKTGIERVTRNIAVELLQGCPRDLRVELVRFHEGHYVYARPYACRLLELDEFGLAEEIIEVSPGDIFFGLDWAANVVPGNWSLFQSWRDRGALVYFVVYDLLPVLKQDFFPTGAKQMCGNWLGCIASCADGIICISKTVADEFLQWIGENDISRGRPLRIGYSYLGAELDQSQSEREAKDAPLSTNVANTIKRMRAAPSLLMVGTIEPRKGHKLALRAFEDLWNKNHDLNLIVVGKAGWMMDAFVEELRSHPAQAKRLFWLPEISDRELGALYKAATALLVASEGEGFGLPIIEAARHGIPVIARDLPVFREVAGEYAHYFADGGAEDLGKSILEWLTLAQQGKAPSSTPIPRLTWQESAMTIQDMLLDASHSNWLYSWRSACPRSEPTTSSEITSVELV